MPTNNAGALSDTLEMRGYSHAVCGGGVYNGTRLDLWVRRGRRSVARVAVELSGHFRNGEAHIVGVDRVGRS